MNEIGTGMVQMLQLTGGYQEKNIRPENKKRRRWIHRAILCVLLLFLCILGIRRGANAFLAKQAEGKLQTVSSYKEIYQSFERVESKQFRLRRKWENHRGINLSLDMGINLSYMMSGASSAASSVMGAVHDVTGVGGSGIGQYRHYMMAASEMDGNAASGTTEEELSHQDIGAGGQQSEGASAKGEDGNLHFAAEPDQWIAQGDYIYTLWMKGTSYEGVELAPSLVIYYAAGGQMEQVYEEELDRSEGYEMEMMVFGNYLYLARNNDFYEYYDEYFDEMVIDTVEQQSCLLHVYDISDPEKPMEKGYFTQSGSYYSMKIEGEYLYMISKFQGFTADSCKDTDDYVPKTGKEDFSTESIYTEEKLSPNDIYMQRDLYETGYIVIGAYQLSDSGEVELTDAKAVAGTGECIQWSSDTIYICSQVVPKSFDQTDRTGVTVLSYQDGKISGKDHLIVKGSIDWKREADVNEARLYLPMQVSTYRGSFVEVKDWFLPGWESVPMKILMQESAIGSEKRNISIDGIGKKVHETDVALSEEKIRDTGFKGQLFAVNDTDYIGVGHIGEEKNLALVWYVVSDDNEPWILNSVSLREHYSPVTSDSRMIYFDWDRCLIGFCATGSKGTFYYLYRYQWNWDMESVEFQELCQENFGNKWRASWIRAAMLHPEENILYMVRSGDLYMKTLAKPIEVDS